ncbi:hypothetical protein GCM10010329_50110 [Streptomyces spiroverticillatus]|uniref:Uncharacterized protein n=1 Tax=Streptomyces finlayi TaxID=67296 RepID=A0A919CC26_9ACTN|nr:hypothetical protein [Streptomyces finlayi]GHA20699.1 hypothetical protein GCM10010329_50110 [Streptomyces spiroverticillatus]GHD03375.1 hypothetical protein GCM10010334_51060 [Streptomyces finlayi]
MAAQPWPLPRLVLAVAVTTTEAGRTLATFTVTNAKAAGVALVDPGDGGEKLRVTLTAQEGDPGLFTGTTTHPYTVPGHTTYTASAVAAAPSPAPTWSAVPDRWPVWPDVEAGVVTWEDVARTEEYAEVPVTVDVGDATVWATVYDAYPLPRIHIATWIAAPDKIRRWTLRRYVPSAGGDFDVDIWAGDRKAVNLSLEDGEAPLDQPVTYRLTLELNDGTRTVLTSNEVMISGTRGCFLTDTRSGRTVPVQVQAWDAREWESRQSLLVVMGRADPVVLTDRHVRPKGTWSLLTRSREELESLYSVLLSSRHVLLRTQAASSLKAVYVAVGNLAEQRLYPGIGNAWERLTQVQVQEVAPIPATARIAGTTWTQLAAAYETWEAVAERFPSWLDVGEWIAAPKQSAPPDPGPRPYLDQGPGAEWADGPRRPQDQGPRRRRDQGPEGEV